MDLLVLLAPVLLAALVLGAPPAAAAALGRWSTLPALLWLAAVCLLARWLVTSAAQADDSPAGSSDEAFGAGTWLLASVVTAGVAVASLAGPPLRRR